MEYFLAKSKLPDSCDFHLLHGNASSEHPTVWLICPIHKFVPTTTTDAPTLRDTQHLFFYAVAYPPIFGYYAHNIVEAFFNSDPHK